VLVGRKPHLVAAVGAAHPRPLHRDSSTAERHLARLVPVPHRAALRVVPALRADDVVDLFLHQLGQHPEPDTDTQRKQSFLRCPDQLPKRFLDALRQHRLLAARLRERYVALHGGSLL
jgi:hypothetical protein